MFEEVKNLVAAVVTVLVISLAVTGAVMLVTATVDNVVIHDCQEQGWHNFGQTRIICSVEPKKEVK